MFVKIVQQALLWVRENFIGDRFIILRNFTPETFENPFIEPSLIFASQDFLTQGHFDFKRIEGARKQFLQKLLSTEIKNKIMPFEVFFSLSKIINFEILDVPPIILKNDFSFDAPAKFIGMESFGNTDSLDEILEDQTFPEVYASIERHGGVLFVQSKDLPVEPHPKEILLFEKIVSSTAYQTTYKSYQGEIIDLELPFSSDSKKDLHAFYSSLFFRRYSTLSILVNIIAGQEEVLEKQLNMIRAICEVNSIAYSIYKQSEMKTSSPRPELLQILKNHWKSNSFRQLEFYSAPDVTIETRSVSQGEIIEFISSQIELAQNGQQFSDIFLTAPTGAGKSILFQIPAIYCARNGLVTIIVSPLKALMFDQVSALKGRGYDGVAYINSDISFLDREKEIERIKSGAVSILYLSPELLLSYDIKTFIGQRPIGLLAIDECHLVTTWGRDFRVDYWFLGKFLARLRKTINSFPLLCLTATAVYQGEDDTVFETSICLNLENPKYFIGKVRRDNIVFQIASPKYSGNYEIEKENLTANRINSFISSRKKVISYFPWINQIESIIQKLPEKTQEKVGRYFSQVSKEEKEIVTTGFKSGRILGILATKAFGMGVDIEDIDFVYHHAPSGTLCDYIQEIGRAARRKDITGTAAIDFSIRDLKYTKILYGLSKLKQFQLKLIARKLFEIYEMSEKRQNFLISPEDFGFIFPNEDKDSLEVKLKSGLLLLENDLLDTYRYNVLVVRPKALFTRVFACVKHEIENRFMARFGKHCRMVNSAESNSRQTQDDVECRDIGHIYEIQLDKLWEENFSEKTFGQLKRDFFERRLFQPFSNDVYPRYSIKILLKEDKKKAEKSFEAKIELLKAAFEFGKGKFLTESEIDKVLKEDVKDPIERKKMIVCFISLFSSKYTAEKQFFMDPGTFIQVRREENGREVFRVVQSYFSKVHHEFLRVFNMIFPGSVSKYHKYLAVKDRDLEKILKVAYLLEAFDIGHYELSGGELPKIFLRINDPYKVRKIAKDPKYSNQVLAKIDAKHERSVKLMGQFFTSEMSDSERWDYVEKYFLGQNVIQNEEES